MHRNSRSISMSFLSAYSKLCIVLNADHITTFAFWAQTQQTCQIQKLGIYSTGHLTAMSKVDHLACICIWSECRDQHTTLVYMGEKGQVWANCEHNSSIKPLARLYHRDSTQQKCQWQSRLYEQPYWTGDISPRAWHPGQWQDLERKRITMLMIHQKLQ